MNDTRDALLAAGVALYSSLSCDLLRGLTAGDVAKEAGYHRQTFYRYWETQGEFVNDMIRWVLCPEKAPVADGVLEVPAQLAVDDGIRAFARNLAYHDLAAVVDDPITRMQIGLLMMRVLHDEPYSTMTQEFHDETVARLAEGYDKVLAHWGREPVPGVTSADLARMIQAQMLGVAIQVQAAVDDPPGEVLLEQAVVALLEGLTRPVE